MKLIIRNSMLQRSGLPSRDDRRASTPDSRHRQHRDPRRRRRQRRRDSDVAGRIGVHYLERHRTNRGLAAAFRSGLQRALDEGADIIVNTDADNQYEGADIAALVEPIVAGRADVVIGDRGVGKASGHFGWLKRKLQGIGSATVRRLSRTHTTDAVSGFAR